MIPKFGRFLLQTALGAEYPATNPPYKHDKQAVHIDYYNINEPEVMVSL
jgi:hypothetical protein